MTNLTELLIDLRSEAAIIPQNTAWNRASREQKLRIAKRIEDAMPKPCCDHHNEPHFCTHEEEVNGVYEQCGCEGD